MARLRKLLEARTAPEVAPRRRYPRPPNARQCLQEEIRSEVIQSYQSLRDEGQTLRACSQRLQVAERTLRFWEYERRSESVLLAPVGRPLVRSSRPVRQAILAWLQLTGPGLGVPSLVAAFPDVPRRELADLLARYRAVGRARQRTGQRVLHWQTPGRVWAADFTERPGADASVALDPYVLAVRDLASGRMLAWQALPAMTEDVTRAALAELFTLHGAPLVLKMDNGSAFRAARLRGDLEASGVIPLYSPPACPGYNGAIEAAIGAMKKRTADHAARHGRRGRWERADLAAARLEANASHPRRLNGRTPDAVWAARTPLRDVERVVFGRTIERQRFGAKTDLGIDLEETLDHWRASAVDRQVIERALVEHGYLLFTRRRIPLTIRRRKVTADG